MTREEYISLAKSILFSSAKKSLIQYFTSKFPFLLLPFFNPIFTIIIEKLVKIMLEETELRVSYLYTDFRVGEQGKDFLKAAEGYKNGTVTEKDLIDSFRSLIKFSL